MKETPGGIILLEVLQMKGKFTKNDILEKVVSKISSYFSNKQEMENYIDTKIETLCEYNLIGRTDLYFFEI